MHPWREFRQQSSECKIKGDYAGAIACLEKAIALASDIHPVELALMNNTLAGLYLRWGDFGQAEVAVREAIRLEIEFGDGGKETTHLSDNYILLGRILEKQNRFTEAADFLEKAVGIVSLLFDTTDEYVVGVTRHYERLRQNAWRG